MHPFKCVGSYRKVAVTERPGQCTSRCRGSAGTSLHLLGTASSLDKVDIEPRRVYSTFGWSSSELLEIGLVRSNLWPCWKSLRSPVGPGDSEGQSNEITTMYFRILSEGRFIAARMPRLNALPCRLFVRAPDRQRPLTSIIVATQITTPNWDTNYTPRVRLKIITADRSSLVDDWTGPPSPIQTVKFSAVIIRTSDTSESGPEGRAPRTISGTITNAHQWRKRASLELQLWKSKTWLIGRAIAARDIPRRCNCARSRTGAFASAPCLCAHWLFSRWGSSTLRNQPWG